MELALIKKKGRIIAEFTRDNPLSVHGEPVWTIRDRRPRPGKYIWQYGNNEDSLRIIGYRKGWLICKLSDGFLHGIIWDDGFFHTGCILNDKTGFPVMRMSRRGNYTVQGAIKLHHDSLGFALPVTDRFLSWDITFKEAYPL